MTLWIKEPEGTSLQGWTRERAERTGWRDTGQTKTWRGAEYPIYSRPTPTQQPQPEPTPPEPTPQPSVIEPPQQQVIGGEPEKYYFQEGKISGAYTTVSKPESHAIEMGYVKLQQTHRGYPVYTRRVKSALQERQVEQAKESLEIGKESIDKQLSQLDKIEGDRVVLTGVSATGNRTEREVSVSKYRDELLAQRQRLEAGEVSVGEYETSWEKYTKDITEYEKEVKALSKPTSDEVVIIDDSDAQVSTGALLKKARDEYVFTQLGIEKAPISTFEPPPESEGLFPRPSLYARDLLGVSAGSAVEYFEKIPENILKAFTGGPLPYQARMEFGRGVVDLPIKKGFQLWQGLPVSELATSVEKGEVTAGTLTAFGLSVAYPFAKHVSMRLPEEVMGVTFKREVVQQMKVGDITKTAYVTTPKAIVQTGTFPYGYRTVDLPVGVGLGHFTPSNIKVQSEFDIPNLAKGTFDDVIPSVSGKSIEQFDIGDSWSTAWMREAGVEPSSVMASTSQVVSVSDDVAMGMGTSVTSKGFQDFKVLAKKFAESFKVGDTSYTYRIYGMADDIPYFGLLGERGIPPPTITGTPSYVTHQPVGTIPKLDTATVSSMTLPTTGVSTVAKAGLDASALVIPTTIATVKTQDLLKPTDVMPQFTALTIPPPTTPTRTKMRTPKIKTVTTVKPISDYIPDYSFITSPRLDVGFVPITKPSIQSVVEPLVIPDIKPIQEPIFDPVIEPILKPILDTTTGGMPPITPSTPSPYKFDYPTLFPPLLPPLLPRGFLGGKKGGFGMFKLPKLGYTPRFRSVFFGVTAQAPKKRKYYMPWHERPIIVTTRRRTFSPQQQVNRVRRYTQRNQRRQAQTQPRRRVSFVKRFGLDKLGKGPSPLGNFKPRPTKVGFGFGRKPKKGKKSKWRLID